MSKRKICVVTGTRADYGLLQPIMALLAEDADFELQIIATGMHCSPEFGLTQSEITRDGFRITESIEMLLSSDTAVGVTKSMGLGTIGFAEAFARLQPDLVFVLGDRFEILAAAQAAMIARLPLAHACGGDTTEGAVDEAIRHSITKMAHMHFVTNQVAWQRVRQLGENPACIWNVGSPGIDHIKNFIPMTGLELAKSLGCQLRDRNLLITFHPSTLDDSPAVDQCQALLDALAALGSDVGLFITQSNADVAGRQIAEKVNEFVRAQPNAYGFVSLGTRRYLSLMAHVDAVVGNSSSGLYEAPSFKIPTVNIGKRQQGRLQATSVINAETTASAILAAIREAFDKDCSSAVNPYGDGQAAERIVSTLKSIPDFNAQIVKTFHAI